MRASSSCEGGIEGELIGYYSDYRDKITSVLTGEVTPSGRLVVQSRNAASLRLYGAEFAYRQEISPTLSWRTQLTWTRGEERLAGDSYPADRIPPLNGSVGAGLEPCARAGHWRHGRTSPSGRSVTARATRSIRASGLAAPLAGRPGTCVRPGRQAAGVRRVAGRQPGRPPLPRVRLGPRRRRARRDAHAGVELVSGPGSSMPAAASSSSSGCNCRW